MKGKYTAHALEVLRRVRAGQPFDGRSVAGRRHHLNWLETKGLVHHNGQTWKLTTAGEQLISPPEAPKAHQRAATQSAPDQPVPNPSSAPSP